MEKQIYISFCDNLRKAF